MGFAFFRAKRTRIAGSAPLPGDEFKLSRGGNQRKTDDAFLTINRTECSRCGRMLVFSEYASGLDCAENLAGIGPCSPPPAPPLKGGWIALM